ncbi:MAG TPA: VanZ family protein [Mycobacteriales bacterium]|nr:VanZ family protein [Mycobacteriales bacterium]
MLLLSLVILFAPSGDAAAPFPHSDKLVHGTLFALLAGTSRWRFGSSTRVLLLVCAYAPLSEVVQAALLPDRDGDWHDAVADLLGVALGWLLAGRLLGTPDGRQPDR